MKDRTAQSDVTVILKTTPLVISHALSSRHSVFQRGDIMEIVDPILEGDFNSDEAVRMIKVALVCTNSSPVDDPPPPSSYTLPLSEDDPPPPSSSYTLPLSVDDPSSSSSSYIYSFFLIFLYASLIFLIAIISNSRSILLAIFLNFVCSVKASG
ncbi:unnamed protein product [Arabidopsis lyrata]|nr:unnamed protein product [Arabidopsis lyrata]